MRANFTPTLERRIRRAQPMAQEIIEALAVTDADVKDTRAEFAAADSFASFQHVEGGGVRLTGTFATLVDHNPVISVENTDLDTANPVLFARLKLGGSETTTVELNKITARLDPNVSGGGKTVDVWECRVFGLVEDHGMSPSEFTLFEIARQRVGAGASVGDVVFDFSGFATRPKIKTQQPAGTNDPPTIFIQIVAFQSDGSAATNVAWEGDGTTTLGTGNVLTPLRMDFLGAGEIGRLGRWRVVDSGSGLPRIKVEVGSFTTATLTFSGAGNKLDLLNVPGSAADVEFVAQGRVTTGTSFTFEAKEDGGVTWVAIKDGQTADDVGLPAAQKYDIRAVFTPSADTTPILDRLGAQVRTATRLDHVARVLSVNYAADPFNGGAEIAECVIGAIHDGRRDYHDAITDLLSSNHIGAITFRIYLGHESDDRDTWMLVDEFLVDDTADLGAAMEIPCVSVLALLRGVLPVPTGTSPNITRAAYVKTNVSLKTAADDLLDGQAALPGRHRGPGIENDSLAMTMLDGAITSGATSLTVDSFVAFPRTAVYRIRIDNEILEVTAGQGTLTWTVTRGVAGTSAASHDDGAEVSFEAQVTKTVTDSRIKTELDALAFLAGGAWISSQGRVKFVPLRTDRRAVAAVFRREEIRTGRVSPGFSRRVPEFFVRYDWNVGQGQYDAQWKQINQTAFDNLGLARIEPPKWLSEEIGRWIDTDAVAETVSQRQVDFFGFGEITISLQLNYAHPELEIGDPVSVQTDQLVARNPLTGQALRGLSWVRGVIVAQHDIQGRAFTVWVPSFSDIISSGEKIALSGFSDPGVIGMAAITGAVGSGPEDHLWWGKLGAPATNNPLYKIQMDASAVPKTVLLATDGTTPKTFLELDYATGRMAALSQPFEVREGLHIGAGYTDPPTGGLRAEGQIIVEAGGLSVLAGTTAVQALTATTGQFTNTVRVDNKDIAYLTDPGATSASQLRFDRSGVFKAALRMEESGDSLELWTDAAHRWTTTDAAFHPAAVSGLTLGTAALPWGSAWMGALTATTATLGTDPFGVGKIRSDGAAAIAGPLYLRDTGLGTFIDRSAATGHLEIRNAFSGGGIGLWTEGAERARLTTNQFMLGTSTPATGNPRLDVVGGGGRIVAASVVPDGLTDVSVAYATRHRTAAEEPFGLVTGIVTASNAVVRFGGGESGINAATIQQWYTAGDTITPTGTIAADLTGVGTASLWHFRGDIQIASLGRFDSADTPTEAQLLIYKAGAINKWQAETLYTLYAAGDHKADVKADNTAVTYVLRDRGTGPDDPVGAPPAPSIGVFRQDHLAHTFDLAAYAKPDDFRYFEWEYCTGAACSGFILLARTTSTNLVHSRLVDGTVYRYRVRAVDRAGNASGYSAITEGTATANSSTFAVGGIVAGQIAVADLAAINANIGLITAGQLRNAGNTAGMNLGGAGGIPGGWTMGINVEAGATVTGMTRYLNLAATGSASFLKHERLEVNVDGVVKMYGSSGRAVFNLTASDYHLQEDAATPTRGFNIMGTRPASWTTYVDLASADFFIKHDRFELKPSAAAEPLAIFKGQIDIENPRLTVATSGGDSWIKLRKVGIAHGMTGVVETDVTAFVRPFASGGLELWGLVQDETGGSVTPGVVIKGVNDASEAAVVIVGRKKSGTGDIAMTGTNLLLSVRTANGTGPSLDVKADGTSEGPTMRATTKMWAGSDIGKAGNAPTGDRLEVQDDRDTSSPALACIRRASNAGVFTSQGIEGWTFNHHSTGTITAGIGTIGAFEHTGAGTTTNGEGLRGTCGVTAGTLTNAISIKGNAAYKQGAGAITNAYTAFLQAPGSIGSSKNITLWLDDPAGTGANTIEAASGAKLTTGGTWTNAPSYRRYKEDIEPIGERAVGALLDLRPVTFRDKRTGHRAAFFIMENYRATMEQHGLIEFESDGIASGHVAAILTAGWQSHEHRLRALERQVLERIA